MNLWLLAAVGVLALGVVLWLPRCRDVEARAALGASLVTGGILSFVFFYLQNENEKQDSLAAAEQALRVRVGLSRDLSGADLSKRDLDGFDLAGKVFSNGDLHQARLTRATLVAAILDGSNLEGAQLDWADLSDASLKEASLNGVDLSHAVLTGAHLEGAAIGPAPDGARANLVGAWLVDAHLSGACLASADLRDAVLGGADLSDAVLAGADLRGAILERDGIPVNVTGASLVDAKIDPESRHLVVQSNRGTRGEPHAVEKKGASSRPLDAIPDRVTHVSDADTVELRRLGWVRLVGVDAMDIGDPLGKKARAFLIRKLSAAPEVRYVVSKGQPQEPRAHGRWRAYIWLSSGEFLNEVLLEQGYVRRQRNKPEDAPYTVALDTAERRARVAGLRAWKTCTGSPGSRDVEDVSPEPAPALISR